MKNKKAGRPPIDYKKNSINTERGSERESDLIEQCREAIKKLRKNPEIVAKIEFYKRAE